MRKFLLNQMGSVQDIHTHLQHSGNYTLQDIEDALQNELLNKKRSTVITMLERQIRKRKKGGVK